MNTVGVIEIDCPGCGKHLKVRSEMAGQRLICPKQGCGASIDVPGSAVPVESGVRAKLMTLVGITFAAIAAVLTVKQLDLHPGWFVLAAMVAFLASFEFVNGFAKSVFLTLFSLAGLSTPVLFFLLERKENEKEIVFYVGTALYFIGSAWLLFRTYNIWSQYDWGNRAKHEVNRISNLVWFALIASSLAFSWSTYFRFFTPQGDDLIVRRLMFTLFFVLVGVICSVAGRNKVLPFLGVTGLTYMAAGILKALAYDIFKTDGVIRIGVFAGCGVVLLIGGLLMKKTPQPKLAAANVSAFIED